MKIIRIPRRISVENFLPLHIITPLILFAVAISASTSLGESGFALGFLWVWIHLGTIATAGLAALLIRWLLITRGVRTVSIWFVVMTGGIVGVIKATLTSATEAALALTDSWTDNLLARVIGASLAAIWVMLIAAYAQCIVQQLREARADVVRHNVASRLQTAHSPRNLELNDALNQLRQLRESISSARHSPHPAAIREVVDSTIRPLSRALWATESARYPEISLRSFLERALESGTIRAGRISTIWVLTSLPLATITWGVRDGIPPVLIIGAVAYVLLRLASRFVPRSPLASLASVTALSALANVGGWALSLLWPLGSPTALNTVNLVVGTIWLVLVFVGLSMVAGASEIDALIHRDLSNEKTEGLLQRLSDDSLAEEASKRLAIRLHGEVQSTLLGIAAAAEGQMVSYEAISRELDRVTHALSELIDARLEPSSPSGHSVDTPVLESLIDNWRGLMSVTIDPDSATRLLSAIELAPEIIDILREALANAYRHGLATHVAVACQGSPHHPILSVSDNGYGPKQGTPGLGSALLDLWSDHNWTLQPGDSEGSILRIELAIPR